MFALRQAGLGMGMREWYAEIGPVWYVPYVCVCIAAGGLGSGIKEMGLHILLKPVSPAHDVEDQEARPARPD